MQTTKEAISIIVPIYNVGRFIAPFFEAMSSQTFNDFKLYLVYDKSDDDTLANVNKEIDLHRSIKAEILFSPEKKGLGFARDFAIDSGKLTGKYVITLDPDDSAHSNFLEKLYNAAETNNADITFCGFRRVDAQTKNVISIDMVHNPNKIELKKDDIFPLVFCNPATWNKLIRIDTIKDCRYIHKGGTGEDAMFYCKLIPYCNTVCFVNEVLIDYMVRPDSFSAMTSEKNIGEAKEGYLEVKEFYHTHESTHSSFQSFLSAVVFLRLGIGTTTRVALSNKKIKKKTISETKTFLDEYFPSWHDNSFLSLRIILRHNKKTLFVWLAKKLYQLNEFGLFVSLYKAFTTITKRDIKW